MKVIPLNRIRPPANAGEPRATGTAPDSRGADSLRLDLAGSRELEAFTQVVKNAHIESLSVEDLREAIRDGGYEPDLGRLADHLIEGRYV